MRDATPAGPDAPRWPAQRSAAGRIELLPNCSLTPAGAWRAFTAIGAGSLAAAFACALQGWWPVLPFAGLELALLGWALAAAQKRRGLAQTVEIFESAVAITKPGAAGPQRILFSRHWAKVTLRGPRGWLPSRLLVESHGRGCEVGEFLTDAQREALARRLRALIGRTGDSPPLAAGPQAVGGANGQY